MLRAMRRWVVVGSRASASGEFSLLDIAGTSGRFDVLLRCLRAALCVSHGLRQDTVVYLVLLGGQSAPRTMRIRGSDVRFLRPEERALATMVQKALAIPRSGAGFVQVKPGIAIADAGIECAIEDCGAGAPYVLDERAPDVRGVALDLRDPIVFVGDHLGLEERARQAIDARGAIAISIGPLSIHAEDAITIASNELDRRARCSNR